MIVIAYFHYNTGRSDIEKFETEYSAKKWLFDRWGFLPDEDLIEENFTLDTLIEKLRDVEVKIEILRINTR